MIKIGDRYGYHEGVGNDITVIDILSNDYASYVQYKYDNGGLHIRDYDTFNRLFSKAVDVFHRERLSCSEEYFFITSDGRVVTGVDMEMGIDETLFNNYNYFPCNKFSMTELINDNVVDMSKLERMFYTYFSDDWVSKAYKYNGSKVGYSVNYDCNRGEWSAISAYGSPIDKLVKTRESATEFAKYLNEINYRL